MLVLSPAALSRGEDNSSEKRAKFPALDRGEQPEYELVGTVVDETQKLSYENLAKLTAAQSLEELSRVAGGLRPRWPASNVVVTAKGISLTKKTKTDSQGKFKFTGLPGEQYEILVEAPSMFFGTGEKRMARARIPFSFDGGSSWVHLELRTDLVTIKGRIKDSRGQPIAGAKVCGKPCGGVYLTSELEMGHPTRYAISDADGFYELKDLVPPGIGDIGCYLMGLDPLNTAEMRSPFYAAVDVEADGFIQDKKNAPRVPLVTEELLPPARCLLNIYKKWQTLAKGSSDMVEKEGVYLPPSQGNTITGVDIVLEKAGGDAK